MIVRYRAAAALCRGAEQNVLLAEEPLPRLFRSAAGETESAWTVRLRYRVDRFGRPHRINRIAPGPAAADERDVPAAFAAWRFRPGRERSDCEIGFRAEPVSIDRADADSLHRYLVLRRVLPDSSSDGGRAARRIQPSGRVCADGSFASERSVAYPDWRAIGLPAGTFTFSRLRGDVKADGVPENVRVIASSGNDEMNRQSVEAVNRSRFPGGARHDCLFYYIGWRERPLEAPAQPAVSEFRDSEANCPSSPAWVRPPRFTHPPAFKARRIEGWAILRYDLSPAGAVIEPTVLAAEPASAFGEAASIGLAAGVGGPSASGYRGCIERVEFRLPFQRSKSSQGKPGL
ncbi:MAG TPA: hypothetical protein VF535_07490 [Allosphingosinicella sp.]